LNLENKTALMDLIELYESKSIHNVCIYAGEKYQKVEVIWKLN